MSDFSKAADAATPGTILIVENAPLAEPFDVNSFHGPYIPSEKAFENCLNKGYIRRRGSKFEYTPHGLYFRSYLTPIKNIKQLVEEYRKRNANVY